MCEGFCECCHECCHECCCLCFCCCQACCSYCFSSCCSFFSCCENKKCQSKNSFLLYFIYLGIIFLSSIIFIFTYKKYDEDINDISYEIEKTLNTKIIYSIKNKTICDVDEEELVLGSWDGTKEGCFCEGVVYDYECSDKLVNQGCKIIPAHNKINYTIINSNYICIKRSKLSYRDLLSTNKIVEKSKNCPINYKFCGTIDTLERKLCVENNDICPITKSIIEEPDLNINSIFNYMNLFKEQENLNDNQSQILSVFQLNQKLPCINPNEKYWDYHYLLENKNKKCETKVYDEEFDDRYEKLSKYTTKKYELYMENGIIDKLVYIDNISLNKIKNDIVYLFGRRLLGLDKNILDKFDFDKLKEKQNLSNICNIYMLYALFGFLGAWALIIAIVIIIAFNVKEIGFKDCSIKCEGLNDRDKCTFSIFFSIGAIATIIVFIGIFIFICIIFNSYKSIENIINLEGSDEYLHKIIEDTFKKYYINFIYPLIIIILFSLQIIILLISLCFYKDDDYINLNI